MKRSLFPVLVLDTSADPAVFSIVLTDKAITLKRKAKGVLAERFERYLNELWGRSGISLHDLRGIVIFRGPGSYTSLRIGIAAANALAFALEIPLIGTAGENWQNQGIRELARGRNDRMVTPRYAAPPQVTRPKNVR